MSIITTKLLAKELGLTVNKGVAFGQYNGYDVLLKSTWTDDILLVIYFHADDMKILNKAVGEFTEWNKNPHALLESSKIAVNGLGVDSFGIVAEFYSRAGALQNSVRFLHVITLLLGHYGIKGHGFCARCGREIGESESFQFDEELGTPVPVCRYCSSWFKRFWSDDDYESISDKEEEPAKYRGNASKVERYGDSSNGTDETNTLPPFFSVHENSEFKFKKILPSADRKIKIAGATLMLIFMSPIWYVLFFY